MWGIIPAAGLGSRIQPLAFSKELLPVGSRHDDEAGQERPRAVSEYLVERLVLAGATKLCFVIAPGKSDILNYYGAAYGPAAIAYVVQPRAGGLCDAIFRAAPLIDPAEAGFVGVEGGGGAIGGALWPESRRKSLVFLGPEPACLIIS